MKLGQTKSQDLFAAGPVEEESMPEPKSQKKKFTKRENEVVKKVIFAMSVKRHVVAELEDLQKEEEEEDESSYHAIGVMFRSLTRKILGKQKKPPKGDFDLHDEDRSDWDHKVLNETVDLSLCHVDSPPFQIVEQTSLFKVHSLFSLLGPYLAYASSSSGRLVGVLSLK